MGRPCKFRPISVSSLTWFNKYICCAFTMYAAAAVGVKLRVQGESLLLGRSPASGRHGKDKTADQHGGCQTVLNATGNSSQRD